MLRNYIMSLAAYHIALLVSYLSVWVGASYYDYTPFNYLLLAIYLTNSAVLIVNLSRKELTRRFSNRMLALQIINWFILFGVWDFFMANERVASLLCAMMVLSFLFAYSSFIYSLILTSAVASLHAFVSWLGIVQFQQPGTLSREFIHLVAFFFSALLIAGVMHRLSTLLREKASNDHLTKLLNRRAIGKALEEEFKRCKRFNLDATLVMIDLDDFKIINDTWGHSGGDVVLIHVANILKKNLRELDYIGRWGGEEFIILLPGSNILQSKKPIERILQQLNNTPAKFHNQEIFISFSSGMALITQFESVDDVIREADRLLYIAKSKGKNRIITAPQQP